jgi:hypothetical protein
MLSVIALECTAGRPIILPTTLKHARVLFGVSHGGRLSGWSERAVQGVTRHQPCMAVVTLAAVPHYDKRDLRT